MTGPQYYQSFPIYQMVSGNVSDSLNVMANQGWAHAEVMPYLYNVPLLNFGAMNPYVGAPDSLTYLLNPFNTIGRQYIDANGNLDLPFLNVNNFGMMPGGYSPWGMPVGGSTSGSSSGVSGDTPEEKDYHRKFNKLMNLMKTLKDSDAINARLREQIQDKCISTTVAGKTNKEKYEELKKIYDEIKKSAGADSIKAALVQANGLGAYDEYSQSSKNSFEEKLIACGYEYEETSGIDDNIQIIHAAIGDIKNSDSNKETTIGTIDTVDILDFISSWNSHFENNDGVKRQFIQLLVNEYNELDESTNGKVKDRIVKISNALVTKAKDVIKSNKLDADSKTKLNTAIEAVKNILTEESYSTLNDAFNNLYLLTRMASIAVLRNEVVDYYGFIDNEVFNDKLFDDKTREDLIEEGFEDTAITGAEMKIDLSKAAKVEETGNVGNEDIDKETVKNAITKLKALNILTEDTKVTIEGTEYQVYKCTKTGNRYIIKDNEIKMLNANNTVDGAVKPSVIKEAYNNKKAEEERDAAASGGTGNVGAASSSVSPERIQSLAKKYTKENMTKDVTVAFDMTQVTKTPQKLGKHMQDCLNGATSESDWKEFKVCMDKIDESNVLYVMRGYFEDCDWWSASDKIYFFEQLFSEDGRDATTHATNIGEAVLKSAEEQIELYKATKDNEENPYVGNINESNIVTIKENLEKFKKFKKFEKIAITKDNASTADEYLKNLILELAK